jgi:hypothetical protein
MVAGVRAGARWGTPGAEGAQGPDSEDESLDEFCVHRLRRRYVNTRHPPPLRVHCDLCKQSVKGDCFSCSQCDIDVCLTCLSKRTGWGLDEWHANRVMVGKTMIFCGRHELNHGLHGATGWTCDGCKRVNSAPFSEFSCRACNIDVCRACVIGPLGALPHMGMGNDPRPGPAPRGPARFRPPPNPLIATHPSESPRRFDIGEFRGTRPGDELLVAGAPPPPASVVRDMVARLGATAGAPPQVVEGVQLAATACSSLVARVERSYQLRARPADTHADFKTRISLRELRELAGEAADRLVALMGQQPSKIWLRRTRAAAGRVIPFHLDVSRKTLRVPLNDPAEYDGGLIVFALATGKLLAAPRAAGSATLHDCFTAHGVSELTRGTRYALFLLVEDFHGRCGDSWSGSSSTRH